MYSLLLELDSVQALKNSHSSNKSSSKEENKSYYWYEWVKVYDNLNQFARGELEADLDLPKVPENHAYEVEQ